MTSPGSERRQSIAQEYDFRRGSVLANADFKNLEVWEEDETNDPRDNQQTDDYAHADDYEFDDSLRYTTLGASQTIRDLFDTVFHGKFYRIEGDKFYFVKTLAVRRGSTIDMCVHEGVPYIVKRIILHSADDLLKAADQFNNLRNYDHPHVLFAYKASIGNSPTWTNWTRTEVRFLIPFVSGHLLAVELSDRRKNSLYIHPRRILRLLREILDGLFEIHSHSNGDAHRDIRPETIMIRAPDDWPVLLDLDACTPAVIITTDEEEVRNMTEISEQVTSPYYRAPETFDIRPESVIDERTDIWAVGCALYAMCFFRSPFQPEKLQSKGNNQQPSVTSVYCRCSVQPHYRANPSEVSASGRAGWFVFTPHEDSNPRIRGFAALDALTARIRRVPGRSERSQDTDDVSPKDLPDNVKARVKNAILNLTSDDLLERLIPLESPYPKEMHEFMARLLTVDLSTRPTTEQAIRELDELIARVGGPDQPICVKYPWINPAADEMAADVLKRRSSAPIDLKFDQMYPELASYTYTEDRHRSFQKGPSYKQSAGILESIRTTGGNFLFDKNYISPYASVHASKKVKGRRKFRRPERRRTILSSIWSAIRGHDAEESTEALPKVERRTLEPVTKEVQSQTEITLEKKPSLRSGVAVEVFPDDLPEVKQSISYPGGKEQSEHQIPIVTLPTIEEDLQEQNQPPVA